MLRRRPIARRAVRTAAVVGTAAAVGHAAGARGQQQAAQQAPPPEPQYVEAAPAPPAGGVSPDAIEQLKELAGLRDQGILSEEEFAAQKAKILG
jgi:hypothetical protein